MATTRAVLDLCRISNLPTVFGNVMASWFLGGGTWDARLGVSALAATLCYCGGMILNDVFDAGWDQRHHKPRPIPMGKIQQTTAAWLGWTGLVTGCGIFLAIHSNPLWTTALAAGIVFYNALHKRWPASFCLMGACRFFLFITVASIPSVTLPARVWLWGAALACYVAGITLAARNEDTSGRVHPGALVFLLLPVGCALAFLSRAGPSVSWSLFLIVAFCLWIAQTHRRLHAGEIQVGRFVGLLLAGMVLIDAMALSTVFPAGAVLCLLLLPMNLLLQAFVPAT